jgi:hypothetical protein
MSIKARIWSDSISENGRTYSFSKYFSYVRFHYQGYAQRVFNSITSHPRISFTSISGSDNFTVDFAWIDSGSHNPLDHSNLNWFIRLQDTKKEYPDIDYFYELKGLEGLEENKPYQFVYRLKGIPEEFSVYGLVQFSQQFGDTTSYWGPAVFRKDLTPPDLHLELQHDGVFYPYDTLAYTNSHLKYKLTGQELNWFDFTDSYYSVDDPVNPVYTSEHTKLKGEIDGTWSWNGNYYNSTIGDDGDLVPLGDYILKIEATDEAGNTTHLISPVISARER